MQTMPCTKFTRNLQSRTCIIQGVFLINKFTMIT